MLVLSDRDDGGRKLVRSLGLIGPCRGAGLDTAGPPDDVVTAIVSDVALNSQEEVNKLRKAIRSYSDSQVPLVCLLRDDTRRARMQAFELGANETMSADLPSGEIVERVLQAIIKLQQSPFPTVMHASARHAALALADMLDAVGKNTAIQPKMLVHGADLVLKAVEGKGLRDWLGVVQSHDDHTYQHCLLVAGLAASFAFELGFNLRDRRRLTKAALLHDIGKVFIPLEILNKPARLYPEELAIIRTHVTLGHDYLVRQGRFSQETLSVVKHHHEYLDGTGYPDGLAGSEIPDLIRLVTICDIYAALIENRAYRAPLPAAEAYDELLNMGDKLDRNILAAFKSVAFHSVS